MVLFLCKTVIENYCRYACGIIYTNADSSFYTYFSTNSVTVFYFLGIQEKVDALTEEISNLLEEKEALVKERDDLQQKVTELSKEGESQRAQIDEQTKVRIFQTYQKPLL